MAKIGGYSDVILKRIEASGALKANKRHLEDLISYLKAKGMAQRTLDKYAYHYEKFLNAMGDKADILKADRKHIEKGVAKLYDLDLSKEDKRKMLVMIKVLYKHFLGDDEYYPKQIAWIRTSGTKSKVMSGDLLGEDEIERMIKAAGSIRDKMIIALLFDSGMRIGELTGIRKKDIELQSTPAHVTVNGKTGMRRVPVMFSVPYLAQYLNSVDGIKPEDSVLRAAGTWSNTGKQVAESGIRSMLKKVAIKAGITKRIYPHLFRHSRASYYANKLTEQQLKGYFGWTGDSKMAATYVHLSGRDIDNAILQANGAEVKAESTAPKLKVKTCQRCKTANGIDSTYCARCGAMLDIYTTVKKEEEREGIIAAFADAMKDPESAERMGKAYRGRKKKGD